MLLRLHVWLFKLLTPVLKVTATIHGFWTHKNVTGVDYYKMWPMLKPGAIFCSRIDGELTTLLVPGHFSHSAIYCPVPGHAIDESVVQAERDGVGRIDLVSFLLTKDEVVVLEPNIADPVLKEKVMLRAAELSVADIGCGYDFGFTDDPHPKAFYCSRVIWYSYDQACQENGLPSLFKPIPKLSVPTVTPQMVATCENLQVIYHAGKK